MSQQPIGPDPTLPGALTYSPAATQQRQANPPWRLAPAMLLGSILMIAPYNGSLQVLVPARIAIIDPLHKVSLVAAFALSGAIVALIANILFGACSDLTRSRFGRRAPWLVVGSAGSAASLLMLGQAHSGGAVVLWWCVFQLFFGALMAPMVAVIPDRVPRQRRGFYSAVYGAGLVVGALTGSTLGGKLDLHTQTGFLVFAAMALLAGPVFAAIAAEPSNMDQPRGRLSANLGLRHFSFPRRGARDLYLALSGKLLQVIGGYALSNYYLYLLTDYVGLNLAGAGELLAVASMLGAPLAIGLAILSGLWSDRLKRRKIFVMGSAFLSAGGLLFPFFAPREWAFLVFMLIMAGASGIYSSVDQALNTEVLPSRDTAAKDLGIVNMANTAGLVLGPALASVLVNTAGGYRTLLIVAFALLVASAAFIKPIRLAR